MVKRSSFDSSSGNSTAVVRIIASSDWQQLLQSFPLELVDQTFVTTNFINPIAMVEMEPRATPEPIVVVIDFKFVAKKSPKLRLVAIVTA